MKQAMKYSNQIHKIDLNKKYTNSIFAQLFLLKPQIATVIIRDLVIDYYVQESHVRTKKK